MNIFNPKLVNKQTVSKLTSNELSLFIASLVQKKKAASIRILDLREIQSSVTDFFIVCSGSSSIHIDSIATFLEKEVYKTYRQNPWHKEGKNSKSWLLLDYVDVVAHIFSEDARSFYEIEGLWGDAKIKEIE